jgi:alanyl-tRNA synthetase
MKRQSREIRSAFIDFWVERGHKLIKSAPLVPREDPTLLFTSAGMVQFKKYYSSKDPLEFRRATTVQKCLRGSDLDNVGFTPRHCTFFEMLGHFSFGDYFKREAIHWNWEFFTKVLAIPVEMLRPSVFEEDDEAFAIWRDEIGIAAERIARLGRKDNFWGPAGDTGACGPSSELYYDFGPELGCGGADCEPGCDCDRWIEIGNFVFPQFDRQLDGSDLPLPNRGIDTGIGLERVAAVVSGKKTIFETDLFVPVIERVASVADVPYSGDHKPSYHIIADHTRALTFALTEGVLPSNEGRGYFIRRLLRRAAVQGHRLGLREPFLYKLAEVVIEEMGPVYPELPEARASVVTAMRGEEERFQSTLEQGLARFEEIADRSQGTIAGRDLFLLYDTFGFPTDLTAVLAQERKLNVDIPGFEAEMTQQRERSRASATFYKSQEEGLEWTVRSEGEHSIFVGYDSLEAETNVRRVAPVPGSQNEWWVVVETTPFYAESGGQVGDIGRIAGAGGGAKGGPKGGANGGGAALEAIVLDTVTKNGEFRHRARLVAGSWEANPRVRLIVDREARDATRRNHTATHLLQSALRLHLGKHVTQAGSLVAPNRLRFDFAHPRGMTREEIEAVERTVSEQVVANTEVRIHQSSYDQAIKDGVTALFGEKYEDVVRRVQVAGFSEELCGGTHVSRTGDIGAFVILSEAGIAAGVRRIEALTGLGAIEVIQKQRRSIDHLRSQLQGSADELPEKIQRLIDEGQRLRKELAAQRSRGSQDELAPLWSGALALPGGKLVLGVIEMESTDGIREMGDRIREKIGTGIGLIVAKSGGKGTLLAVVSDDLIAAGKARADAIVREAAAIAGGSGGGKPHQAMAGVKDVAKIPQIIDEMRGKLEKALGA